MDMIKSFLDTSSPQCTHVPEQLASPSGDRCEECGSTYSLRMCATCGHVGCCESQARDAESHWKTSGHEVMVALPVGRSFTWCYEDQAYVD
jgi:uncharacterized UBP type Zn finger protein